MSRTSGSPGGCTGATGSRHGTAVDWTADPDWDWHSAADDSPEQLHALWQGAAARSRDLVDDALADGGMDRPSRRAGPVVSAQPALDRVPHDRGVRAAQRARRPVAGIGGWAHWRVAAFEPRRDLIRIDESLTQPSGVTYASQGPNQVDHSSGVMESDAASSVPQAPRALRVALVGGGCSSSQFDS